MRIENLVPFVVGGFYREFRILEWNVESRGRYFILFCARKMADVVNGFSGKRNIEG